ncbi:MBL fold metallo-hydrolase [Longispora fulva]|uniref:Glyoxylase-like metal-dependent hydrolase (Beta-lactamase superfamily II) n=1 Tax=Longispora fulva TaxID=619741 RepID=A0A8J7GZB5_9ACTN|nr:MBL fold metallo-hydrolase [Longispora fulva]MBG6141515.1 glyoxylase-like metal-dependent hydrolase (beta-lactamase superfamily II) [Longispora fulva]GIG59334.1 MBL fold metallo-hydrolase [Longispora fulva]
MAPLTFTVIDLDFPVASLNKTATLVTGEHEAMLVDAGFTRADGHRLVAAILDSGKTLTTVFVSHGDPDYYWGLEVVADAFPDARILATPLVIEHITASYEAKLAAWEPVGVNRPTRLVVLAPLTTDIVFEGYTFALRGGHPTLPDRHYLWQAEHRAIIGGVLVFQAEHVWVADTAKPEQRAAWIALLDEMAALDPALVVPGHRLPGTATDVTALAHTKGYLEAFDDELSVAGTGAELTAAMVRRYPHAGMLIAAQIGAKVAKGEMTWG